jgi:hypothetical protein
MIQMPIQQPRIRWRTKTDGAGTFLSRRPRMGGAYQAHRRTVPSAATRPRNVRAPSRGPRMNFDGSVFGQKRSRDIPVPQAAYGRCLPGAQADRNVRAPSRGPRINLDGSVFDQKRSRDIPVPQCRARGVLTRRTGGQKCPRPVSRATHKLRRIRIRSKTESGHSCPPVPVAQSA